MVPQLIRIPEDFLARLALVLETNMYHNVLVSATVAPKVLTTISAMKFVIGVVVHNMLVQYFVLWKHLFTPVTGVRF